MCFPFLLRTLIRLLEGNLKGTVFHMLGCLNFDILQDMVFLVGFAFFKSLHYFHLSIGCESVCIVFINRDPYFASVDPVLYYNIILPLSTTIPIAHRKIIPLFVCGRIPVAGPAENIVCPGR